MKLTIEVCATALAHAALNRKMILQLELAVGLCVFALHGSTDREARAMLNAAYAAAGYHCTHINEMDYKTVNRRINATASLFENLPIKKWVGHLSDMDAIKAVCEGLEPYELFTIQDVLRYAAPAKVRPKLAVKPNATILTGPTTGHDKVVQQFRRAVDQPGQTLTTEHLQMTIPHGTPRAELIDMAMQLMTMAKANELLTA